MNAHRAIELIKRWYPPGSKAYRALLAHSACVANKAVAIGRARQALGDRVDLSFLREAALLHDLGIVQTHAPDIGCDGDLPYICHGIVGRELLASCGYPRHALVCERHIGVGLTVEDIDKQALPLPRREMAPVSVEEEIIAYADLFYSKNPTKILQIKEPDSIRQSLARYGAEKVAIFDRWHQRYGG